MIPPILQREPLNVEAGVSKLTRVTFEGSRRTAILKEPAEFWDAPYIANEAEILGAITHPRVRRRLAYVADTHELFLEPVEGITLQELILTGVTQRDPARTHRILLSVAETMTDLHAGYFCERPIVHNDLKSANVIVPHSAPEEAILVDFSHAYFAGQPPNFLSDKQHAPSGTAKYTAPEKWDGDFGQGIKSDVFAFGVLAYFAYTGKFPFEENSGGIEQSIRESTPASPGELGANILRNVLATIMLCLEKQPQRRPSMEHVARSFTESVPLLVPIEARH